jgi:hypothetical protein
LQALGDALDEFDEKFALRLAFPLDAALARAQGAVTIVDDDPPPSASVGDATLVEGNAGTVTASFLVTLSTVSGKPITVSYSTADGTAAAGSDYVATSGTLTFAPGETSKGVSVSVVGDVTYEPDETFSLDLTNPVNVTLADAQGQGTVVNDDTGVRFDAGAVSVNEAAGVVQLTVTRVGVLAGASAVNYSTVDGTASERSDYSPSLGTLRFAPNEASKTITIFITDDALVESPETFSVALGDPVGAGLASPSTAVVTVNSDDAPGAPNPVRAATFNPTFFVTQHYRDFLNRDPDAPGLAFWTNQTTNCGNADLLVCRINVSAAFFLSPEFQETGFYAIRAQRVAFGKRSEAEGGRVTFAQFIRDARQLGEGFVDGQPGAAAVLEANKQAYSAQVVGSAEFVANFPTSQTAAEYVGALFAKAGVTGTTSERQQAVDAFNAAGGAAPGRVAAFRKVADSASVRDAEFRGAFVLMEYFGYLRRDPDQEGYGFWLTKLNNHGGNYIAAEMVKAFITSGEYLQRFGP